MFYEKINSSKFCDPMVQDFSLLTERRHRIGSASGLLNKCSILYSTCLEYTCIHRDNSFLQLK